MLYGYAGHTLRIDLSTGTVEKEPLKQEWVDEFIGGRGFTAKIWHLNRMFNKREIPDFGRKYDYPPPRFYEEPIPSGPNKGHFIDFSVIEEMLDTYYAARGWDKNGIPTRETLEKFNLAAH